jgi:hypothetical protein
MVRLGAFRGGLEVGGAMEEGEGRGVTATSFFDPPEGWGAEDCRPYAAPLDSIFRGIPPPPLVHVPMTEEAGADRVPGLGFLQERQLLERSGELQELHALDGESGCPGEGDPLFWGVEGSLTLPEGRLCGLLVVGGDLVLEGGALLQGVALVGENLRMEGGAIFQGVARVRESVRLSSSARLEASGCAALDALSRVPALREPLLLRNGSYIRFH